MSIGVATSREMKRGRRGGVYFAEGDVGAMGAEGGRVRSVPGGGSVGGFVGIVEEADMA